MLKLLSIIVCIFTWKQTHWLQYIYICVNYRRLLNSISEAENRFSANSLHGFNLWRWGVGLSVIWFRLRDNYWRFVDGAWGKQGPQKATVWEGGTFHSIRFSRGTNPCSLELCCHSEESPGCTLTQSGRTQKPFQAHYTWVVEALHTFGGQIFSPRLLGFFKILTSLPKSSWIRDASLQGGPGNPLEWQHNSTLEMSFPLWMLWKVDFLALYFIEVAVLVRLHPQITHIFSLPGAGNQTSHPKNLIFPTCKLC